MSTATSTAAPVSAGGRVRRTGPWLLLGVLVLAIALVLAVASAAGGTGERLDPGNPGPDGGRALAQVLAGQGVKVVRVTQSRDVAEQASQGGTVLVTDTSTLGQRPLARLARTTGTLVLVEPQAPELAVLAPSIRSVRPARSHVTAPQCADANAQAAGPALAGGLVYQGGGPGAAVMVCYPAADEPPAGSYAVTQQAGRTVVAIGQGSLLTNGELSSQGNAALALRTLGAADTLVWYVPDPLEAGPDSGSRSLADLAPPWVGWVTVQLALAALLAMLWRGRRLGALISEPLPVVVQAAETQLGRARLYRQARARGRAGDTLRTAALRRLANRLAAPESASGEQLVALVSAATGRPGQDVGRVLLGPPPADDAELVRLAGELDELERQAAPETGPATTAATTATAGERRS